MTHDAGPALVVLAAGLATRFGRPKQLEPIGPSGECLMDYGILDAIRSGFSRVIVVVRRDARDAFEAHLGHYAQWLRFDTACQDLHDLPGGRSAPAARVRPWGTAHAVLAARSHLDGPFAVMNADDFYGRTSFTMLAAAAESLAATESRAALVTFPVAATLSKHGGVSRAVCTIDAADRITGTVEHFDVKRSGAAITATAHGAEVTLEPHTPVSMNLWLLTPAVLSRIEAGFLDYLDHHPDDTESEYLLPHAVNESLAGGLVVTALRTPAEWFGMTFPADRQSVAERISTLVSEQEYPSDLAYAR